MWWGELDTGVGLAQPPSSLPFCDQERPMFLSSMLFALPWLPIALLSRGQKQVYLLSVDIFHFMWKLNLQSWGLNSVGGIHLGFQPFCIDFTVISLWTGPAFLCFSLPEGPSLSSHCESVPFWLDSGYPSENLYTTLVMFLLSAVFFRHLSISFNLLPNLDPSNS